LLDYAVDEAGLQTNSNPFAIVVLAHLKTRETNDDLERRRRWKIEIVRGLYERGFKGDDIRKLFRFIDWLMELPAELEHRFWRDVEELERKGNMPYVTGLERIWLEQGLEKGREQGRKEGRQEGERDGLLSGITSLLKLKFGEDGLALLDEIRAVQDVDLLRRILSVIEAASGINAVRNAIPR
jgi:hypothetical protein